MRVIYLMCHMLMHFLCYLVTITSADVGFFDSAIMVDSKTANIYQVGTVLLLTVSSVRVKRMTRMKVSLITLV